MINFKTTEKEASLILSIAQRAKSLYPVRNLLEIEMDVTAVHCNTCPLRLADLLAAKDFDFGHDIHGIYNCLDRGTAKLKNNFLPRFAK